jgi:antitoxin (DNA-binding transcriptional repressor) of toxin-antitoxin stability system
MYHMRRASVRDLRYEFKKIERLLHQGEEIQITKRRRVIARLVPENDGACLPVPDFLGRLRAIYGEKVLSVSGADLVAKDRSRY